MLYALFKPVNPLLARMATVARLAMTVVQGTNVIASIAVLVVLTGAAPTGGLSADQSSGLAHLLLSTHAQAVHVWEAFFALHCFLLGALVLRAGFVPKVLGPLMLMAALGYLASSLGNLLFPASAPAFASIVAVTAIFGELPLILWLLIKAVNAEAWHKLAAPTR